MLRIFGGKNLPIMVQYRYGKNNTGTQKKVV